MKLICGLGNPELKYYWTRHNIGFSFIDSLLDNLGNLKLDNSKFNGIYTKTKINAEDVIIAKPLTYMNLSGEFIRPLANFYKIETADIIICYDEIAIETGRLRITKTGSSAGHNGIKSIIDNLGTEDFIKFRFGMGPKPNYMDLKDFVLSKLTKEENDVLQSVYNKAIDAIKCLLAYGIDETMNRYNRRV